MALLSRCVRLKVCSWLFVTGNCSGARLVGLVIQSELLLQRGGYDASTVAAEKTLLQVPSGILGNREGNEGKNHFVGSGFTHENSLGRLERVGGVAAGVVHQRRDMHLAAFGYGNRLSKCVHPLPVEIEPWHIQQDFPGAVGSFQCHGLRYGQKVAMRRDANDAAIILDGPCGVGSPSLVGGASGGIYRH